MNPGRASRWRLIRWLLAGEWRDHPLRAVVALGAIALGVALGFAIDLINSAAFNEFSSAVKSLSGQSDLQVRGAQALFNEDLYPLLAQRPEVALANPVLEVDAALPGQASALKILGIDVFRAAALSPDLIGVPAPGKPLDTLSEDAIFLSPAALEWLRLKPGDTLVLRSGTRTVALRVAGSLLRARPGQRIAVMDIGAAQWRFDRIGRLSHVDLKLRPGVDREAFRRMLGRELGAQYLIGETEEQEARSANLSRAYRVNLNVLALVALFTGAFLVFSTQALSVIRRRSQFALLRVIGMTRRRLLLQILLEGGALGVFGSLLGLALGYVMAGAALHFFGGDLGGGYFSGISPTVRFVPQAAALFFLLGVGVALAGSAAPAAEAARATPALALKSGSEDAALAPLGRAWPGLLCLALGALAAQMPPVGELPLFGYLAVALLLIGAIALMPRLAAWTFGSAAAGLRPSRAVVALALARLANAPNQASIALGGVLSSFSLMVAMAIMVASFRVSVDDWLRQILPSDLYLRVASSGDTRTLKPDEQRALAAAPGIARIDFWRGTPLSLAPGRPPVALVARAIDAADPVKIVPVYGPLLMPKDFPPGAMPIWVSEAMVDLYGYTLGKRVRLPLQGRPCDCVVAGIWRDYSRQTGTIQMRLADYRELSGDFEINDAALWLKPGVTPEQAIAAIRRLPFGAALEFAEPGEIRARSLTLFDRSFAITYLLEVVAIVIGLFGVAATFSAQTFARVKEFGMLRHIGVTRRQILSILALEGSMLTAIGIGAGFALGWVISLILVFVVNPQSFHWTMQLHIPWSSLAAVALVLQISAGITALAAGRVAVSGNAVRAVREDW